MPPPAYPTTLFYNPYAVARQVTPLNYRYLYFVFDEPVPAFVLGFFDEAKRPVTVASPFHFFGELDQQGFLQHLAGIGPGQ